MENHLWEKFPNSGVRIHMDYCKDETCRFCEMENCDYRKENFSSPHS